MPNPFYPTTTIRFSIPVATEVHLQVYDVTGRRVATLVDRSMNAGEHAVAWNGRDDTGRSMASGVYITRMTGGDFVGLRRMVLVR